MLYIAIETEARTREARRIRDEIEAALESDQECAEVSHEALAELLVEISA